MSANKKNGKRSAASDSIDRDVSEKGIAKNPFVHKKRFLLMGTVAVLAAVLIPLMITLAKYTVGITGYTDFEAARFNAAIINPTDMNGNSLTVMLSERDFRPGMKAVFSDSAENASESGQTETETDTAVHTRFTIANGTNATNATSTALQYNIRIRTSNSLPLKYTLMDVKTKEYYSTRSSVGVIQKDGAEKRYEYSFEPMPAAAQAASVNGGAEEIAFILDQGSTDNPLVTHDYELIVEWPSEFSDRKYMKEVEIVEIVVTVTSLNKLDDDNYGNLPGTFNPDYHSEGIIVLRPPANNATESQSSYEVDLRSFYVTPPAITDAIFKFSLDNAVSMGAVHSNRYIRYNMKLIVPAELKEENGYVFSMSTVNADKTLSADLLAGIAPAYWVYDELTGTPIHETPYTSYSDAKAAAISNDHKVYIIYDLMLSENNTLTNKKADLFDNLTDYHDSRDYVLKTNKTTGSLDELAFYNKLRLIVDAEFTDSLAESGT